MFDKFNITTELKNNEFNKDDIIKFVDELLYNNSIIYIPGFLVEINQEQENINTEIKKYILSIKKNIKTSIKKKTLTLSEFNKIINTIISKLNYICNIINNKNYKSYINELSKHIISEQQVLLFLEDIFSNLNLEEKNNIIQLFSNTKIKISEYDKNKTFNKLLQSISNSTIKQSNTFDNIKSIIDYINKLNNYFDFLLNTTNDFTFLINITNILYHKLYELINQDINNFIKVFDDNEILYKYVIHHHGVYKLCLYLINTIFNNNYDNTSTKIINIIDRIFKTDNVELDMDEFKLCINRINIYINNNIENIINYIDTNIRNSISSNIIDNELYNVFSILNNTYSSKYKSNNNEYIIKFFELYNNNLIKRVFDYSCKNIDIEYNIVNKIINTFFDKKNRYNTNKIINNFKENLELFQKYNFCGNSDIDKFNGGCPIIYSYGLLNNDNNQYVENIYLNKSCTFSKILDEYNNYYVNSNIYKKLFWLLHMGEINITFNNVEFIMYPIHFMILELFDNIDKIKIKDIYSFSFLKNYDTKFIDKIIYSLLLSNIIKSNDEYISLNNNTNSIKYNTNIIKLFNENNSQPEYNVNYVIPKKDIICSNINHILKQTDANKLELFNFLKDTITVFKLTSEDFDNSIEYMIRMDYIENNNGIFNKLY